MTAARGPRSLHEAPRLPGLREPGEPPAREPKRRAGGVFYTRGPGGSRPEVAPRPGPTRGARDRIGRAGRQFRPERRDGVLTPASRMSEESNIRFVRSIWEAIREGGIEAGLEKTPGVEWRPHAAGGQVLTTEEALKFFAEFQGERELLEVVPYSYHAHGDYVLASGSFRLRGPGPHLGVPDPLGLRVRGRPAAARHVLRHARRGTRRRSASTRFDAARPRALAGAARDAAAPRARRRPLAGAPADRAAGAAGLRGLGQGRRPLRDRVRRQQGPQARMDHSRRGRARSPHDRDGRRARHQPRPRHRALCA